jgi:hypothetical protein
MLCILTLWLLTKVGWGFLHELIFGREQPLRSQAVHSSKAIFHATAKHRLYRKVLIRPRSPMGGSGF